MDTLYWLGEYGKLFCAFIFFMFIWPCVVFGKHLKNKDKIYKFGFCVTVQMLIVTIATLTLGFFHILNNLIVIILFYGVFAVSIITKIKSATWNKGLSEFKRLLEGTYGFKSFCHNIIGKIKFGTKQLFLKFKGVVMPHIGEYTVLAALIVYAIIYFSYGAFQNYGYGAGDMYVHHQWIDGMLSGNIFSDGVYPQGMDCFIYGLHVLFGIKLYNIIMLLPYVQLIVTILSVYLFLRIVFRWKYSPLFVIALFLTVGAFTPIGVYAMARFQWALPQEFGMYAQFLCVVFLIRYLQSKNSEVRNKSSRRQKPKKYNFNENLTVFATSLAASAAIHYYCAIVALILLIPFVLFNIFKLFDIKKLIPLLMALLCGLIVALAPLLFALAAGYPPQSSLYWITDNISGDDREVISDNTPSIKAAAYNAPLNEKTEYISKVFYWKGYARLYGKDMANLTISMTLLAFTLWAVYRIIWLLPRFHSKNNKENETQLLKKDGNYFNAYLPVIFASVLFIFVFVSKYFGLIQLVPDTRVPALENLLLSAVVFIPLDMIFTLLCAYCKDIILQIASAAIVAAIYIFTIFTGTYHSYLYKEITRYNTEVTVAESIIESFPPGSYTIVSCTNEMFQANQYGMFEELLTFIREIDSGEYFLPTEYVFIFVEKRPFEYGQKHFYTGSQWLGLDKYGDMFDNKDLFHLGVSEGTQVNSSVVNPEDVKKNIDSFESPYSSYQDIRRRTILESKAYQWCLNFKELFPFEMNIYYEDDNFVCYYFKQNTQALYNLSIEGWDNVDVDKWAVKTEI